MTNYWLLKTEPQEYSWQDLIANHKTVWDGVKNYTARNNLKQMQLEDLAFIYHTGTDHKCIVGVATVVTTYYLPQSETTWGVVEVIPRQECITPLYLHQIKLIPKLQTMVLLKQSRLSVVPISKEEALEIANLTGLSNLVSNKLG